MADTVLVADVSASLAPVFRDMLRDRELETLRWWIERRDDGRLLGPDERVGSNDSCVRWEICDEDGGSGSLQPSDGTRALVRAVQSDLQDFIAESRFAWGELRGPHDLP